MKWSFDPELNTATTTVLLEALQQVFFSPLERLEIKEPSSQWIPDTTGLTQPHAGPESMPLFGLGCSPDHINP